MERFIWRVEVEARLDVHQFETAVQTAKKKRFYNKVMIAFAFNKFKLEWNGVAKEIISDSAKRGNAQKGGNEDGLKFMLQVIRIATMRCSCAKTSDRISTLGLAQGRRHNPGG